MGQDRTVAAGTQEIVEGRCDGGFDHPFEQLRCCVLEQLSDSWVGVGASERL